MKSSEQHALCQAVAKEILSRAGEHNHNFARPFASIAAKFAAARQENPDLSPSEAFQAFDLDAFMQGTSSGATAATAARGDASSKPSGAAGAEEEEAEPPEEAEEREEVEEKEEGKEKEDERQAEGRETPKPTEGGGGGGDAAEYDDRYIQPVRDDHNITFQTRILNQHLVCTLCMGYFKDACTIIECLHTFCKGARQRDALGSEQIRRNAQNAQGVRLVGSRGVLVYMCVRARARARARARVRVCFICVCAAVGSGSGHACVPRLTSPRASECAAQFPRAPLVPAGRRLHHAPHRGEPQLSAVRLQHGHQPARPRAHRPHAAEHR